MDADGRLASLRVLVEEETVPDDVEGTARSLCQVCRVASRSLGMSGAAISVMTDDRASGIVAAADQASTEATELQFTVGEGPGWDAFESRSPVMAADLYHDDRWPGYRSSMGEHGIRAAFAFPLLVGPSPVGVLDLFRREPGRLLSASVGKGLDFAALAAAFLLGGQDQAPDGQNLAVVDGALESRFPIYQAQGMLRVQLGVSLPAALARLRAHAYSHDRTLGEVSRDVISRTLTMADDQ